MCSLCVVKSFDQREAPLPFVCLFGDYLYCDGGGALIRPDIYRV